MVRDRIGMKELLGFGAIVGVLLAGCTRGGSNGDDSQEPSLPKLQSIVSQQLGVNVEEVKPAATLKDLGADELDMVELVMEAEDEFNVMIPDQELDRLGGGRNQFASISIKDFSHLIDELRAKSATNRPRGGK